MTMYKISKKAIKDCLWLYENTKEFFDSLPVNGYKMTRNRPVTAIEVSENELDKMIAEGFMIVSISKTVPMKEVKLYADTFNIVMVKATDYKKVYKHFIE